MAFALPASEAAKLAALQFPAIGQGVAAAAAARGDWLPDDTERWLNDYPLPATFKWNGERAYPRYRLKKGYGFWLRTAGPYHPALRGLFMLCHEILATCATMPAQEQLAALVDRQSDRKSLPLSHEDTAAAAAVNPAEDSPATSAPAQASGKPATSQTQPSEEPDCPHF